MPICVSETLLLIFCITIPAILLGAYVLDSLGYRFSAARLGIPALGISILAASVLARAGWRIRFCLAELIDPMLIGGVVLTYSLWLAWPSLAPVAASVDIVHHFLLTDYIFRNGALPHDPALLPVFDEMLEYPFGATLVVAMTSWLTNIEPIGLLHLIPSIFLAISTFTVCVICGEMLGRAWPARLASLLASALPFTAYRYFIWQFTLDYHLTQMLGQVWLIMSALWLTRWIKSGRDFYLVPLVASALALTFCYPSWQPALLLTIAVVVSANNHLMRRKVVTLAAVLLPIVGITAFYVASRLQVGMTVLRNEGVTIAFGLDTLGLPLALALVTGLYLGTRRLAAGHIALLPAIAITAALLLQTGAMYLGAVLHATSFYSAHKMWFQNVFFLAIVGSITIHWGLETARSRLNGIRLGVITLLVVTVVAGPVAWSILRNTEFRPQPIGSDLYAVAIWAKEHQPRSDYAYIASSHVTPYWIEVGILNRPRVGTNAVARLIKPPQDFLTWYADDTQAATAFTDRMDDVDLDLVEVIHSHGSAGIVRRLDRNKSVDQSGSGAVVFPLRVERNVHITGVNLTANRVQQGEVLPLTANLDILRGLAHEYLIAAHLIDENGITRAQSDYAVKAPQGPDALVRVNSRTADMSLSVPPDAKAGTYTVEIFALTLPEYGKAPLRSAGMSTETRMIVGTVAVTSIDSPDIRPHEAGSPVRAVFGGMIELLDYSASFSSAAPRKRLDLELSWHALRKIDRDYSFFVHVLDKSGKIVAQHDGQPLDGRLPTTFWRTDEDVRGRVRIEMDPAAASAACRIVTGVYSIDTMARLQAKSSDSDALVDAVELGMANPTCE